MGSEVPLGVEGVEIGHWTNADARTGCTVIVLPPGTVGSGEVRGGAPATREFALLAPERRVNFIDAIVITGGSAFGLAAADGAMAVLEAEGRGFVTPHARVPIVPAMALYDLGVGDPGVRPGPDEGRHATLNRKAHTPTGAVGAGTGATVHKWLGAEHAQPGGLGVATVRNGDLVVTAVVAANAAGTPDYGSQRSPRILSRIAAGDFPGAAAPAGDPLANTTLVAVLTNAALSKLDCHWVAQGGHDGLARAFVPAHTRSDGDAVVVAATGGRNPANPDQTGSAPGENQNVNEVRLLAVSAVVEAAADAVGAN